MAAKDAHTCRSLLFSVLNSALNRRDALHASFSGLRYVLFTKVGLRVAKIGARLIAAHGNPARS
jgi:hypothetical protein